MLFPFAATYEPNPEELALLATCRRALHILGLVMKQAAGQVGKSYTYLDDGLNGRRPLKFSHLYRIHGFKRAFMQATAEEEHCSVFPNEQVTLVIHVHPHGRPMLKASLPPRKVEDVA